MFNSFSCKQILLKFLLKNILTYFYINFMTSIFLDSFSLSLSFSININAFFGNEMDVGKDLNIL